MNLCIFFFLTLTEDKDGGRGATAGGRNRQAAQRSVVVCEQIKPSEMKLAGGTPGQNAAVQTCSELRVAEVIILFYFIFASDQHYDLIVLTFNSHRLTQSPCLHTMSFEHPIN